jgi:MSHA biogenesis protein MshI
MNPIARLIARSQDRWRRRRNRQRLAVSADGAHFAYALADADGALRRCGVEARGADDDAAFTRRVRALGLPAADTSAVLALAQAQLITIDAPAVHADEMKAAARWRIKDQVEGRLDELTVDVMVLGSDEPRPHRQLYVAAARTALIDGTVQQLRAAGLEPAVVDIAETAQRNLQSACAAAEGLAARATAALVRHGEQCLLTVCAGGELYYARRLAGDAAAAAAPPAPVPQALPASFDDPLLEGADIVDYGADPEPGRTEADVPPLVIEMQRSVDLWERSWPALPLAALWIDVGDGSAALATLLQQTLGLRTALLDSDRVFPGWRAGIEAAAQPLLLPLLGALLRTESRSL